MRIFHDFDSTGFCRKCGIAVTLYVRRGFKFQCTEATNVTGVSHKIARRQLERIENKKAASKC